MEIEQITLQNKAIIQRATPVLEKLEAHGFRAHIVGGAVRDLLMGRPIDDVDIVTSAKPVVICTLFPKTFTMNNQHETVIVRHDHHLFEVTTERNGSLQSDLMARDFTVNSIALKSDGSLLDPLNGQADLDDKVLRSYQPMKRMTEDPLRMLRAVRFMSDLGFSLDRELMNTIKTEASKLQYMAIERIVKEFYKLICGKHRNEALEILRETKLYQYCQIPSLNNETINKLKQLPSVGVYSEEIIWTLISKSLGLDETGPLKSLLLSNQLTKEVRNRLLALSYREKNDWDLLALYTASRDVAEDVEVIRQLSCQSYFSLKDLKAMWNDLPITSKKDLNITGTDLIAHFQKEPGPWVKDILQFIEQEVVLGRMVNDKHEILDALKVRGSKNERETTEDLS
ncbi:CCA tRNA nucleotidyltransferase [Alkalihalophilus lindianensis]|uniref:CCA tRNA nucleotidyltransferase n=1 Tax=Alkalihalophilus lindianensis TaxID=1630542 RepID=A0ABU3X6G4_9BACI|nr:CCA tRNA nucleotidyltransferase [Alkalihalophilus lindianensis]MDV2683494.1 CCA tRNA nucleotidyltransferase [Alkalihalophilus lindianensis]